MAINLIYFYQYITIRVLQTNNSLIEYLNIKPEFSDFRIAK